MKFLKGLTMTLTLAILFAACSKNNDDTTPPPFVIEGKWSGKIGTGAASPSGQYALNIKPNGTVERINGSGTVTASGNWQLNGNSFTATYHYSNGTVVSVNGSVDKVKYKLTGNWENNGGEEGTLYASKE